MAQLTLERPEIVDASSRTLDRSQQASTSEPEGPTRGDRVAGPWRAAQASRGGKGMPIALQIAAMIGIGALLYPSAADWFATLNHNSEISGYVSQVAALPDEVREAKLEVARQYNELMPAGPLRDPYSRIPGESDVADAAGYKAYTQVLNVSDNGVIGEVVYPRLSIGLPIYHGTDESVLTKGVGHLYGSSLPVGGPSTHAVLTSHSGLVRASLFTELPKAQLGDSFQVTVLGETHHYRVDDIRTVVPGDTSSLAIVDGEDYVTLFTCTPIGVNSHRILVRGVRVPGPEAEGSAIAGDGRQAGFPWWALMFLGGSAVTGYLLFAPPRKRKAQRAEPTTTSAEHREGPDA